MKKSEVKLSQKDRRLYAENLVYSAIEDLLYAEQYGNASVISFAITEEKYQLLKKVQKEISEIAKAEKVIIEIRCVEDKNYYVTARREKKSANKEYSRQ